MSERAGKTKDGARLFTQNELEKLIARRLVRERKNCEAFASVRAVLDELMNEGIINADSYAEAARELYDRLSAEKAGNMREGAAAELSGNSGCCEDTAGAGEKVTELEEEKAAILPGESEDKTADFPVSDEFPALPEGCGEASAGQCGSERNGGRAGELCALMEKYPEADVELLLTDRGFMRYCDRYPGELTEQYEGYMRLMDILEGGKKERGTGEARRVMASTSFSRFSASPASDAGYELSPMQRDIARRAGMSYREYYEMLRDIPDSKKYGKTK